MDDKKLPSDVSNWLSKVVEEFSEFSTDDKITALDGIIDTCEAPELKYLSDRLEIFLKRDFVRFLPTEIRIYLLSWLDPISLGRCCLVSKTWNEAVAACQPAWVRACKSIGWKVDETIMSGIYWKKTYQRALTRLKQLRNGSAFDVSTLIGHAARVYALRYNGRDLLASGSDDRSVRLWDVATSECLQVIKTHTCADLAFDEFFVYTASFDNTVSCWDWNTGELVRSYRGHTGAVFSVAFDRERELLVSGSADKTVRLWQLNNGEQINMYHGHREWVTKVILQKSEVESLHHKPGDYVILSMDKIEIRIWLISEEVNYQSLCELSASDSGPLITNQASSYPTNLSRNQDNNTDHCFLHPQLLFDGSRILCSSERGVLEWDFKDYTLTRVTQHPNDPSFLLGAGKTMFLAADTCENCLFIRVHGSNGETRQHNTSSVNRTPTRESFINNAPSPETVDYQDEYGASNIPSGSNSSQNVTPRLLNFSDRLPDFQGPRVTPTDEPPEGGQNTNTEDEVVNDINYNNIKLRNSPFQNSPGGSSSKPDIPGVLGRWNLPMCRWSKRGSNYACGDQSWLNGFSDVNHSGLVFAAALPDHSIYLLRWSDCS